MTADGSPPTPGNQPGGPTADELGGPAGGTPDELPDGLAAALAAFPRDGLVALDFDGVLAPIVAVPSAAAMPPVTRTALERLAAGRPAGVALVSGRALADLTAVARPPAGTLLVGSHGAEVAGAPSPLDAAARELLATVTDEVRAVVEAHLGTTVETKPAGVVLHTRTADRAVAAAAAAAVLAGPATRPGVRTTRGKEVVELSVVDVDKGRALLALREELQVPAVLYAGDDVTDEHAFEVLDDDAGDVTVKVGEGRTAARWRVDGPDAVPALLAAITRG
ncbi:MAG: trehalose-phosphatase [Kineosporiaceae bacterium]